MSDGFRQQFLDPRLLPGHELLEQIGDVRHMCPDQDCVRPVLGEQQPNPFCPVCLGAGSITTERLDRWQVEQNRKAELGGV